MNTTYFLPVDKKIPSGRKENKQISWMFSINLFPAKKSIHVEASDIKRTGIFKFLSHV